jgi:NAD(P)H-quinone oxidoreductase subunit 5
MSLSLTALAIPLIHALAAFACVALPESRHALAPTIARAASLAAFVVALAVAALFGRGSATTPLAFIDGVSVTLLVLIAFLGLIVTRYSATALRDEARGNSFLGWLGLTLAAVLLLVQATTLWLFFAAWVATSLALRRLLLFYPERPLARKAALKRDIAVRSADVLLALAFVILWLHAGTGDIAKILATVTGEGASAPTVTAAALIAGAALLKSAQFPFHGWLTPASSTQAASC